MKSYARFCIGLVVLSFLAINAAGQICCDPYTDLSCNCDPMTGICDRPESPLMLKLSEGPWRLTGLDDPVQFDIRADGRKYTMGWTDRSSDIAFLALDRNGNGAIDDGSELFGNATPLPNGTRALNGFFALAQYDENHDGVIDESDRIWNSLLLWVDRNHDGISQSGELTPISASAIKAIGLANHWTGRHDASGNLFRYEGVTRIGRRSQSFYDIYYVIAPPAQSSPRVTQSADSDVELRQAVRRLAAEPPDVAREYEQLASEPLESRRHLFAALPSSMKSAVWAHHLLRAVTTHTEFTAEQRSVIYDAIRLLSPARYETGPATGRKDLDDLALRVQRLFSPAVALSLFEEIGSAIPIAAAPEAGVEPNRESTSRSRTEGEERALPKRDAKSQLPVRPTAWDCECSLWSTIGWCALRHGTGFSCQMSNCNLLSFGCGFLNMDYCDGTCVYTPPPQPT